MIGEDSGELPDRLLVCSTNELSPKAEPGTGCEIAKVRFLLPAERNERLDYH